MAGTVEAQDVIVNMIKETVPRTYPVDKKLTILQHREEQLQIICVDEDRRKTLII